MARTATEIQTDLDAVNAAIQELITNNRVSELSVSTNGLQRTYKYSQITLDMLKELRAELMQELTAVTPLTSGLSFRNQSTVPLRVDKFLS